jgi:hypothetical protein
LPLQDFLQFFAVSLQIVVVSPQAAVVHPRFGQDVVQVLVALHKKEEVVSVERQPLFLIGCLLFRETT